MLTVENTAPRIGPISGIAYAASAATCALVLTCAVRPPILTLVAAAPACLQLPETDREPVAFGGAVAVSLTATPSTTATGAIVVLVPGAKNSCLKSCTF